MSFYGEFDPGSERTLAAWIRHASRTRKGGQLPEYSGELVSTKWVMCLLVGDNTWKQVLIPHVAWRPLGFQVKGVRKGAAERAARSRLACWRGKSPPRLRSVGGLRGWSPTLGLRYGPDSYGGQQSRGFGNGRKSDRATPRAGRRS